MRELVATPSDPASEALLGAYSADKVAGLRALSVDVDGVSKKGLRYERLDQLAMEHLLGARA